MCRGHLVTLVGRVRTTVPVAVKTVQEESAENNDAVQRKFLEEAIITWQFEHENVVQMCVHALSSFVLRHRINIPRYCFFSIM